THASIHDHRVHTSERAAPFAQRLHMNARVMTRTMPSAAADSGHTSASWNPRERSAVSRAMQPVSWSRSIARVGILGLLAAALALTGCSSSLTIPSTGPLVSVEMRGGMCPNGACDSSVILDRDGRVHSAAKPPNDLGRVDAKAMAALDAAI